MAGLATQLALQTAQVLEDRNHYLKVANVNPSEVAGAQLSLWIVGTHPAAAAIPTSAAVVTKATVGAVPFRYITTGKRGYISSFSCLNFGIGATQNETSTIILYDRLIECGGLSGSITTTQTVNTPTLPTRLNNANGADVEAFFEDFVDLGGTTGISFTIAYTDSAGNAQTSVISYDQPNMRHPGRMTAIPTAAGAAPGFKSIESVTLSVSTGATGNFGVVLARRIGTFPATAYRAPQIRFDAADGAMAPVHPDACIWFTVVNGSEDTTGSYGGVLGIVEEP